MDFLGTKGKWYQSHRQIPNDEEGMYATQIYTEDGETIATLSWYPKPKEKVIIDGKPMIRTGTYREANALLISKSPILFEEHKNEIEFLKIIKRQLGDLGGSMEFEVEERIEFLEKLCFESVNI